ncbi:MAG: exported protein of unknown function [Nitrospira sp.]|jgi:hypothetical protein|nr:exported protein of unknown function [Nitrospira sp.]
MNQPRSGLLTLLVMGALLCLSVSGLGTKFSAAHAANITLYEITGTVEALDAKTDPPVILLKSLSKTKEELVVGAVIKQGAMITRGTQRIGLDHIRSGDSVTLKYVKGRDGLTVRSIMLHRE